MKLLILSDTHRSLGFACEALEKEAPEAGTVRFHRRYQRFLAEGAEKEKPGQNVK